MRVENRMMMLRFIFIDTDFMVSAASSPHYELQSRRSAHRKKGKARVSLPGPFSARSTGEVSPLVTSFGIIEDHPQKGVNASATTEYPEPWKRRGVAMCPTEQMKEEDAGI